MVDAERRKLLAGLGMVAAASGIPFAALAYSAQGSDSKKVFDPRQYGARGDGQFLDSAAINAAIDACARGGGGTVSLAPGIYRCGAVILKSNVTFNIGEGATLLGSTNLDDYTANGGSENKHLIMAKDAENVALLGTGRIDGQGSAFWRRSGKTPMPPEEGWNDVIARYWEPSGPRPSPMLNFVNCKGLRVEQLHIGGAAGWTMQLLNCDQVGVRGVSVKNPNYGPNTDGMDIVGSSNVLISDCSVDTGDDAIVLKSDKYSKAEPRLTRNITVTNCVVTTCCNGLKIGTETQGGFENITFTDCSVINNDVSLRERVTSGIALEIVDGGWIDGVHISGIKMQRTRTPIFIRLGSRSNKFDFSQHGLRNVTIENVQASEAILTSTITGVENAYVENVTLSNIKIDSAVAGQKDWVNRPVPEIPQKYPDSRMFGMPPASGLYCRHVRGLRLTDATFRSPANEERPVMICDDVKGIKVFELSSTPTKGQEPVVKLIQCADVAISHSTAPPGSKTYLAVEGRDSASIVLSGCDLRGAKRPFETSGDVQPGAVTENDNGPTTP